MGGCIAAQVCGYSDNDCYCPEITSSVVSYNALTDQWTTLADLPRQRTRGWAATINGKVYYIGGRDGNDTVWTQTDVYDVASNTWSTPASMTLPIGVSDPFAFAFNSTLYFGSGYYQNYSTVATVWTFDTADPHASWVTTVAPPMIEGRGDTCSFVVNGLAYVLGGFFETNFCQSLPLFEVYDPVARQWTQLANMDFGRGDPACAGLHGEFHAFGGQNTTDVSGSCVNLAMTHVEAYTPSSNAWTEEYPELPDPRFRFFAASLDDVSVAYIIGGQSTETFAANGMIYYPVIAETLRYSQLANPFSVSPTPTPAATTPAPNQAALAVGLGIGLGIGLPVVVVTIVALYCCCCRNGSAAAAAQKSAAAGAPAAAAASRSSGDDDAVPLTAGSTGSTAATSNATSNAASSHRTGGEDDDDDDDDEASSYSA